MKKEYGVYTFLVVEGDEERSLKKAIKTNKREIKSVERSKYYKPTLLNMRIRYYIVFTTEEIVKELTVAINGSRIW